MPRGFHVLIATLAVAALTLPSNAAAAEESLVPVAYHPYPDDVDPFGLPYFSTPGGSWGYFEGFYSFLDEDKNGFDFPSLVVDGFELVEGSTGDVDGTYQWYRDAFDERRTVPAPVQITVSTLEQTPDHVAFHVRATSDLEGENGLRLHWVLTEDDVVYKAAPAFSNGVEVHRFTSRVINEWPPEPVSFPFEGRFEVDLDPEWDADLLSIAVWIQNQDEASPRFELGEVLQAARHDPAGNATTQSERAVLLEMYTATWCASCLFGDTALEHLASEEGQPSTAWKAPEHTYYRTLPGPVVLAATAVVSVLAATWSRRSKGGEP